MPLMLLFAMSNAPSDSGGVHADEALTRLLDGNRRFAAGESTQASGPALLERRRTLVKNQKPIAVVVGCSDSRVTPELVFDVTLGEIFVVRTAGEAVDAVALGSVEFPIEYLGTRLIVVLGHQHCRAVSAAVSGAKERGDIPTVLKAILPAIEATKGESGDPIDKAVRANARDVAKRLQDTGPVIRPRVQAGEVKVVAAYYSLESGRVELLN
jgi:carbonic anhydrase